MERQIVDIKWYNPAQLNYLPGYGGPFDRISLRVAKNMSKCMAKGDSSRRLVPSTLYLLYIAGAVLWQQELLKSTQLCMVNESVVGVGCLVLCTCCILQVQEIWMRFCRYYFVLAARRICRIFECVLWCRRLVVVGICMCLVSQLGWQQHFSSSRRSISLIQAAAFHHRSSSSQQQ